MSRIDFLGCPVDSLTMDEAVGKVCAFVAESRPHVVTVINANKLWHATRDDRIRRVLTSSDLVIPEYAVVWGAQRLGTPLRAHVGGLMLVQELLPVMQRRGLRPFFLGAKTEVVEKMVHKLAEDLPGLQVAGYTDGYFDRNGSDIVGEIRSARPDILFVAMGTPRQELWIEDHKSELGVPVCMGVGGSFDVLAELKKDTPGWARSRGFEWLYRVAQDPRSYWKRYLITNAWFLAKVMRARIEGRNMPVKTA